MRKTFRHLLLIELHELFTAYKFPQLNNHERQTTRLCGRNFLNSEWILWMKRSGTLRLKIKLTPNCFCSRKSKERESRTKKAALPAHCHYSSPQVRKNKSKNYINIDIQLLKKRFHCHNSTCGPHSAFVVLHLSIVQTKYRTTFNISTLVL